MHQPLTERQRHVLRGVCDGLANKEIARELGVSESAVKATIQQLFRRTRVRTRVQLVRIVIERSLSAAGEPDANPVHIAVNSWRR